MIDLEAEDSVINILRLCDPKVELTTEADFISFWSSAREAIQDFTQRYLSSVRR